MAKSTKRGSDAQPSKYAGKAGKVNRPNGRIPSVLEKPGRAGGTSAKSDNKAC